MKKVVLYLQDGFDGVISITAIGRVGDVINVRATAVDLTKADEKTIYVGPELEKLEKDKN